MPSWWGKFSSKDVKKKTSKENFIETIQRFINPTGQKGTTKLSGSLRRRSETDGVKCSQSVVGSRSPSPSKHVSRCQSFSDIPHAHPLPLPRVPASELISQSSVAITPSPILQKRGKPPLVLPLPSPHSIPNRPDTVYVEAELATASVSSNCSAESEDTPDSRLPSPVANDFVSKNILR